MLIFILTAALAISLILNVIAFTGLMAYEEYVIEKDGKPLKGEMLRKYIDKWRGKNDD